MASSVLGPYRLEALLGQGGMGSVYRAFDQRRGRYVALKLLVGDVAQDPSYRERFRRESRMAAQLNSPHVIPIHDFGELDDGRLFIDMRLCEGVDLGRTIERNGPLSAARAVEVVSQIADALDVAHRHGLVHRDVKPGNVMLEAQADDRDFVYLVDFGIVRALDGRHPSVDSLTGTGALVGTLPYMAPELFISDEPATPAADIYALGCVLHEILTGSRPYSASNIGGLIHQHLNLAPPRPSRAHSWIPPELDEVIVRALEKGPTERWETAGALARAARRAVVPPAALSRQAGVSTFLPGSPPRRHAPALVPWPPSSSPSRSVPESRGVPPVQGQGHGRPPYAAGRAVSSGELRPPPPPGAAGGATPEVRSGRSAAQPEVRASRTRAKFGGAALLAVGVVVALILLLVNRTPVVAPRADAPRVGTIDVGATSRFTAQVGDTVFTTSQVSGTFSAIDVTTRAVRYQVPTGAATNAAVSPDRRRAYVVGGPGITVIDLGSRRIVKRVQVGGNLADIALGGDRAFVVDNSQNRLTVVDLDRDAVVDSLDLGVPGNNVVAKPDGTRAYIATLGPQVLTFDVATRRLGSVGGFTYTYGLAIDRAGSMVYATDDSNYVGVISTIDDRVVQRIATGDGPASVSFSQDERRAFVANPDGGTVSVVDLVSSRTAGDIKITDPKRPSGGDPLAVSLLDDRFLLTSAQDSPGVAVYDTAAPDVVRAN